MTKNWAIAIGINQYEFLQPLKYAKRDAQLIQEFLRNEAGFERVFFFSDDSPDVGGKSTRPYRANLLRVLRELFEKPFMEAGDNFWFFFSGHGMRHADRDYLMPSDGDSGDIENTAIPINYVTERLRRCGADNVVLILDACRSLGTRGEAIGQQTVEEARSTGVISIFSCSPKEYSYEIEEIQKGAFTHVLLEGLSVQGQCATVERLNQYLTFRVPELVRQYKNARQTPYTIAEPLPKSHLILIPRYASLADIATLKTDAYRTLLEEDLELAEQLWIRVLAAASGQDREAVKALQQIERLRVKPIPSPSSSIDRKDSMKGVSVDHIPPAKITRSQSKWLSGGTILLSILLSGLAGVLSYKPLKPMLDPTPSSSPSQLSSTKPTPQPKPSEPVIEFPHSPTPTQSSSTKPTPQPKPSEPVIESTPPTQSSSTKPTPQPKPSESMIESTPSPSPTQSPSSMPTLPSDSTFEQGVNQLKNLLTAKKWKEADGKTANIIKTKVFGEETNKLLSVKDWEKLSCSDLGTIDKLWVDYSEGKFGFSVQNRIWQNSQENFVDFSTRVGWKVNGEWPSYEKSEFSLNAQYGHLPRQPWWGEVGDDKEKAKKVFYYIKRCNLDVL